MSSAAAQRRKRRAQLLQPPQPPQPPQLHPVDHPGAQASSSSILGPVVSVGTTALALYGAYKLASLAYEAWNETAHDDDDDREKEDEEIFFEGREQAQTRQYQPEETHFATNRAANFTDEYTDNTAHTTSSSQSGNRNRQRAKSSLFWPFSTMISPGQHKQQQQQHLSAETGYDPIARDGRHPYFIETESYLATEQQTQQQQSPHDYQLPPVISPHSTSNLQGGRDNFQNLQCPATPVASSPSRPLVGRRGRITPQTRQLMHHRGQDLKQCREQVRQVLFRLIPTILKRQVLEGTDFARERRSLKDLRQEKQQLPTGTDSGREQRHREIREREQALWNTIQQKTLTRFIVTQYTTSLLFVVLTVQVSVLLGEQRAAADAMALYRSGDMEQPLEAPISLALEDSKWILEQTYRYMFGHGLQSLIQTVDRIVKSEITKARSTLSDNPVSESSSENWNVLDALKTCPPSQIQHLMQRVDARLRQDTTLERDRSLLRFIQPPSVALIEEPQSKDPNSNHNMRRTDLISETWDLLESPMVDDALQDTAMVLRYQMMGAVFSRDEGDGTADLRQNENRELQSLPLAQMLTRMKRTCESFYATFTPLQEYQEPSFDVRSNSYLRALEHLPSVLEAMSVCYD